MIDPNYNTDDLALLVRIYQTREEERRHLAGQLHDRLSQQLAGLKMDIFRLEKKLQSKDEFVIRKLSGMMEIVDAAVEEIRNISAALHPEILEDLGLSAALEWYSREFTRRLAVKILFNFSLAPCEISPEASINLFRIYQLLLDRSLTYVGVTEVAASLQSSPSNLVLTVKNDGLRGDSDENEPLGLMQSITERVLLLGGQCSLENTIAGDSIIRIIVPLERILTPFLKPIL